MAELEEASRAGPAEHFKFLYYLVFKYEII
jgi:hypothetical protein